MLVVVWLLLSPHNNACPSGVARAVIAYVSSVVIGTCQVLLLCCLAVDEWRLVLQEVIRDLSFVYTVLPCALHTWATLGATPPPQFEAIVGGTGTLLYAW